MTCIISRVKISRCAVFLDGGYIDKVLKNQFNDKNIDFLKFSNNLCSENDTRLRTYYYNCPPYQSNPPTEEEKERKAGYDKFKTSLIRLPRFEFREGKLVKRNEEFRQKRVDTLICVDLVHLTFSKNIEKAILVSGDSDLSPGVKKIKDSMVITELVYSPQSCSDELYRLCDERQEITEELIESSELE